MKRYRSNCLATTILVVQVTVMIIMVVAVLPGKLNARGPGTNQPGAAGNRRGGRR